MKNDIIENRNVQVSEEVNNNTKWYLQDEDGKYVSATACKKVSQTEYTYVSYIQPYISYPSQSAAEQALLKLEMACYHAKMPHYFTVKSEEVPEKKCFVIKDQNNRFVDHQSIFLAPDDDKQLKWWCTSFTTEINSIFRYPTLDYAERVLALLNTLKDIAGFSETEFHIEEYSRENNTAAEMTVKRIPVAKGYKTAHRKLYRETVKQYMC